MTPSGRFAEIVAVYWTDCEVLVRWSDGEEARFRFKQLQAPGP